MSGSFLGRTLTRLKTIVSLASAISSFGSAVAVYNAKSVPPMTLTLAVIAAVAAAIQFLLPGEFDGPVMGPGRAYPPSSIPTEGQSRVSASLFAGANNFDIEGGTFVISDAQHLAISGRLRTRFRSSTTGNDSNGQTSTVEDTEAE
ncbi:hypothetical protein EV361DRAFT_889484 [Lentinula raphanica]|uniref:Uncharacterized protein n=1 Tax=Lentinula raphanica TaxID=153919 RepID=A0AA38UM00_9AGAR|nr:hypothetical protein F5880DRAFT_72183 [Lentinula raphanica]KAJ3843587.1 hypothetical protein F5878DRAFT_604337 [Lentinula raphanica]KAJ3975324.1 hypothetical protein EV361DRAFT_889484 [Lentinula raphanica]